QEVAAQAAEGEGLGDMLGDLDDLFEKSDFIGDDKNDSGLGFSLDFGDLGLSVTPSKAPKKDVHNRQTLPAGTEIPNELTKGDAKDSDVDHGFQRTPTAKKDNELKQLEDGSFSLGDDWDLGDLGEDEGDAPAA